MEWGPSERLTVADVLANYQVSQSTLTRRRKAGLLPSAVRNGPGKRWTFTVADVEAQEWPAKDSSSDQSLNGHTEESRPLTLTSQDAAKLGELRATVQAQNADLERITAERDRARADHEHERTRADAAEREALAQRTRADGLTEQRDDLTARLDRLTDSVLERLNALEARSAEQSALDVAGPSPAPTNHEDSPGDASQRSGGRFSRWFWGE